MTAEYEVWLVSDGWAVIENGVEVARHDVQKHALDDVRARIAASDGSPPGCGHGAGPAARR